VQWSFWHILDMIMLPGWVLSHLAGAFPGTAPPDTAAQPRTVPHAMGVASISRDNRVSISPTFRHPFPNPEMSRIRSNNLWGWWGARDSFAEP
jgi:hypothetical protein